MLIYICVSFSLYFLIRDDDDKIRTAKIGILRKLTRRKTEEEENKTDDKTRKRRSKQSVYKFPLLTDDGIVVVCLYIFFSS